MHNKIKKVNRIGRILVDSLMLMLLLTILVIPISAASLLKIENNNVLSETDIRIEPVRSNDPTKSYRDIEETTQTTQTDNF